nr:ABC transporter permease [Streptomyces sp. CMB-StM0423]
MTIVTGVALLVGFEPAAGFGEWLGVIGVLVLIIFALTSLSVALAIKAKSVAAASNMLTPLMILPMMGSGFVPDSMPAGLQWFADYQPFTPFIETPRGLMVGTPDRQQPDSRHRLVRPDRPGRLSVGQECLQPRAHAVSGLHSHPRPTGGWASPNRNLCSSTSAPGGTD